MVVDCFGLHDGWCHVLHRSASRVCCLGHLCSGFAASAPHDPGLLGFWRICGCGNVLGRVCAHGQARYVLLYRSCFYGHRAVGWQRFCDRHVHHHAGSCGERVGLAHPVHPCRSFGYRRVFREHPARGFSYVSGDAACAQRR